MTTVAEWYTQIYESFSIFFPQIKKHWNFQPFVQDFHLSNLSVYT